MAVLTDVSVETPYHLLVEVTEKSLENKHFHYFRHRKT